MNKQTIYSSKAPKAIGPYSQAVLVNDTLYVSGQIPLDAASGELINENLAFEIEQVMKNINYILEEAKMSFDNVVKSTIYITDMNTFPLINEIYGSFFGDNPPARETVEVSWLPKDVNVEISCIAVK